VISEKLLATGSAQMGRLEMIYRFVACSTFELKFGDLLNILNILN
jgi:hypothetical protein